MIIEKKGKTYTVKECKNHWTVKYIDGGLAVNYQIDKNLCKNENEIAEYIKNNDMF